MSQTRGARRPAKVRSVPVAEKPMAVESGFNSSTSLGVLLVLFVGSGCAALIYEIVWFQMLRLVIGASSVSIAVLLGTFMGGMCIGSLVLPRLIREHHHPLRVYALLEIGIGLIGIVLYFSIPLIGHLYTGGLGHGPWSIYFRGAVCVVCLLPPTILMGATLPAIARWVETTPRGVSRLGFFYGANIAGAVFGCLLAGFYLLRVTDAFWATLVAVLINFLVGGLAILLSLFVPHKAKDKPDDSLVKPERDSHAWIIYVTICLSGMTALGAEVVWTRLLSLLLGATTYTFSIILAVFLIGLGIGSSVGASLSKRLKSPRIALAACQGGLALAIAWSAYMISASLPWWPVDPGMATSAWSIFQLDFLRCMWAMLPPACLWGASFPLALASVAGPGRDPGRLVGGVYAANTLGAIAGAMLASMVMIGSQGTKATQDLMVWLTAGSALLVLTPIVLRSILELLAIQPADAESARAPSVLSRLGALGLFVGIILVTLAVQLKDVVPEPPDGLIAFGRNLAAEERYAKYGLPKFLEVREGLNASVAVSEGKDDDGFMIKNFHVSGKVVASDGTSDMRLQLMLGHIPALLHPDPKSVLIVGCGAGVTAGTFALHPGIERIVICEIEPEVPNMAGKWFGPENNNIIGDPEQGIPRDPRLEIIYDDARHFIATTDEKFDIITSDPIHPWVKGAAALYSTEYHALCKEKINEGGIITLWVPLYESNEEAVKSELASFLKVFPEGSLWANDFYGEGYDIVAMSGIHDIDLDELEVNIDRFHQQFLEQQYDDLYAEFLPEIAEESRNGLMDQISASVTHTRTTELRDELRRSNATLSAEEIDVLLVERLKDSALEIESLARERLTEMISDESFKAMVDAEVHAAVIEEVAYLDPIYEMNRWWDTSNHWRLARSIQDLYPSDAYYSSLFREPPAAYPRESCVLASAFIGRGADLTAWLEDAQLNTDDNLRLQYLAGLSLNAQAGENIQNGITTSLVYPEGFFKSSNEELLDLMRNCLSRFAGGSQSP